jgi:hypothetical protein
LNKRRNHVPRFKLGLVGGEKFQRRECTPTCNNEEKTYNPSVAASEMTIFLNSALEKKVPKLSLPFVTAMFWIPLIASKNAANFCHP